MSFAWHTASDICVPRLTSGSTDTHTHSHTIFVCMKTELWFMCLLQWLLCNFPIFLRRPLSLHSGGSCSQDSHGICMRLRCGNPLGLAVAASLHMHQQFSGNNFVLRQWWSLDEWFRWNRTLAVPKIEKNRFNALFQTSVSFSFKEKRLSSWELSIYFSF